MEIAEERALEAYPSPSSFSSCTVFGFPVIEPREEPEYEREIFIKGYKQAEEDLELAIKKEKEKLMDKIGKWISYMPLEDIVYNYHNFNNEEDKINFWNDLYNVINDEKY